MRKIGLAGGREIILCRPYRRLVFVLDGLEVFGSARLRLDHFIDKVFDGFGAHALHLEVEFGAAMRSDGDGPAF